MPAYNAARTLERTYADIPHDLVHKIILVDDVSRDETVDIARQLGLDVIIHSQNRGYGGNQKTCYDAALAAGADIVVMLHPDYQYDATRIPALIAPIAAGTRDLMLGSRFLGDPLAGGMPRWKYVSNRFLTGLENLAFGLHLSEYHTGLRAYSRRLLETIPYQLNSDDFVFDQELIAQVVAAGMAPRIGEIAVPTRYFDEASSVGFRRSVVYGLSTLRVVGALPAPSAARPALAEAHRPPPGLIRPMSISRNALLRGHGRHRRQRRRDLDPAPSPSTSRPRSRSCARRRRPGSRVMLVTSTVDVGARGARWQRLLAPIAAAPVPAGPRLHVHRLPRQQRPAGPARRAVRSHALGEGEGISRTTVLGTVVVERVVDTVMVVAIAALAVLVLSVRGVMTQRGAARARLRRAARHRARRSGSPPIACPAPTGSTGSSPRWPRLLELGRRLRDGLAVAGRPRTLDRRPSSSAPSPGPPRSCTFLAAGQAVGVELTVGPGGAARERRRAGDDRPVRPGLPRDVRADGGRDRRGLRHPARRRVRARPARPRDDPAHDLGRRRHRDGRHAPASGRGRGGRRSPQPEADRRRSRLARTRLDAVARPTRDADGA